MKAKKILSLVLSLCMILSVMQASFAVLAIDNEKLTAIKDDIMAFDGDVSVAQPTDEALSGYEKIVKSYAALSLDEKEVLDILAFDKLYHKVIDRERRLSIINNTSLSQYDKKHYINAADSAITVLGGMPSYMEEAVELNSVITNKSVTADEKVAAFAAASQNARIYAGLYYASYQMFYYAVTSSSYAVKGFEYVVDAVADELLKADPFTAAKPTKLSKPNAKNYEGGESNPEYIAAYAAYWESLKVYQEWDADSRNHTSAKKAEAMKQVAQEAASYKPIVEVALFAAEAKKEYDVDSSKKDKAAEAVNAYNALSETEKMLFDKISYSLYNVATEGSSYWSTTTYNPNKLYSACVDIGNAKYVDEFVAVMDSIEEPYTRSDIEKAKAAYTLVPSTLVSTIDGEIIAKYKAVLASISADEQNTDKPSTKEYETTKVKYPSDYSKKEITKTIDNLYQVVLSAMSTDEAGVKNSIKTKVFSSEFIGTICKMLYPMLGNLNSLVAFGPNDLANKLTEEKYKLAVEKLKAAATVDENGKVIKDMNDWNKVAFVNGDFGFEDGDKEAFLDALSATFRTVSLITMVISLENNINTTQGTYTYGAYEDLIPVLEALDLNLVMSSDEYTKGVKSSASAVQMDARVRPILAPIADLIDSFASDPVNTALDVLPKLSYALKNNIINDQINVLISKMKMISLDPVDLSTGAIFEIIDSKLQELAVKQQIIIKLDKAEFIATINSLAGCGKCVVKDSVSRESAYRIGINSDKTDAFMVLYRYLFKEFITNGNASILLKLVNLGNNSTATFAVKLILNLISKRDGDLAIKVIGRFLPIIRLLMVLHKVMTRISGGIIK